MPVALKDFDPLRPAEARLVAWLQAGNREICVISQEVPPEDAPEEVRLRASFVRYLALGGCDACRPSEKGLRVMRAYIEGDGPEWAETRGLDLEGCRLPGDLGLFACRFPDQLLLRGAEGRSFYLSDSYLQAGLRADRLEAKGGVFLRDVTATGAVRLLGAKLGGNLEATGARFTAVEEGFAFAADGLEAKGYVFLHNITATGTVRLPGAKLGGDLAATRARFTAVGDSFALNADGLETKGDVRLDGAIAIGNVRLLGANLGGDLAAPGAEFTAVGEGDAFSADRLEAKGGIFLHNVTATGAVRLLGAKLGGNLDATVATFTAVGTGRAFAADTLEVEGTVFLGGMQAEGLVGFPSARIKRSLETNRSTRLSGGLDLTAAQIGEIVDHPDGWPNVIELDRCRYGAFVAGAPTDAEARIRWLSLQDGAHPPGTFHPQPWEECARALREAGHSGAARTVLIEKERRQRKARRAHVRQQDTTFGEPRSAALWVLDTILASTIRYGRQPLLAFLWLAGFWLAGFFVFDRTAQVGAIKPNLPQVLRAAEWVECAEGGARRGAHVTQVDCFLAQPEAASYPRFNALMYAADTLFPVVSFEVQAYWLPDDRTPHGAWARVYLWLHITMGWALTLLAVAGFSGLVKNDSK